MHGPRAPAIDLQERSQPPCGNNPSSVVTRFLSWLSVDVLQRNNLVCVAADSAPTLAAIEGAVQRIFLLRQIGISFDLQFMCTIVFFLWRIRASRIPAGIRFIRVLDASALANCPVSIG